MKGASPARARLCMCASRLCANVYADAPSAATSERDKLIAHNRLGAAIGDHPNALIPNVRTHFQNLVLTVEMHSVSRAKEHVVLRHRGVSETRPCNVCKLYDSIRGAYRLEMTNAALCVMLDAEVAPCGLRMLLTGAASRRLHLREEGGCECSVKKKQIMNWDY